MPSDHSLEIQAFHSQIPGTSPLHLCELCATCLSTYRHRSLLLLPSDTTPHLSPLLLIQVALCSGYTRLLPDKRSSAAGVILHSPGSPLTPVTCWQLCTQSVLSIFGVKLQNFPFAGRKLEMKSQEPLIKPGADFVRDAQWILTMALMLSREEVSQSICSFINILKVWSKLHCVRTIMVILMLIKIWENLIWFLEMIDEKPKKRRRTKIHDLQVVARLLDTPVLDYSVGTPSVISHLH